MVCLSFIYLIEIKAIESGCEGTCPQDSVIWPQNCFH